MIHRNFGIEKTLMYFMSLIEVGEEGRVHKNANVCHFISSWTAKENNWRLQNIGPRLVSTWISQPSAMNIKALIQCQTHSTQCSLNIQLEEHWHLHKIHQSTLIFWQALHFFRWSFAQSCIFCNSHYHISKAIMVISFVIVKDIN